MNRPIDRPDPSRLLEAFVASDRCDKAFAALVGSLQGLVYTSALRRTGSEQLAEEIAQNVFAIMARKVESLRKHPCLTAWALKTTQLQSATAMRGERRRQRKMAAITDEERARISQSSIAMDDQCTWRDAVPFLDEALDHLPPGEQKMILQRFYEEKKFKEIAGENGQTEAACKKRVQRALQKLSSILTSRGVTLSGTAVASLLGAEFARAVPAHTAATLAPNALAASSSISATTLLSITFQTMSNVKSTSITVAAVLALSAIPFSQQRAEANRIQAELQTAISPQAAKSERTLGARSQSRGPTRGNRGQKAGDRTAKSLLASLDGPVDHRSFIRQMMEVSGIADPLASSAIAAKLQRMSLEERMDLLKFLKSYPMTVNAKDSLAEQILLGAPEMSPGEKLDALIVWGRSVSNDYMHEWATSDPDAAMQWFQERRASGALDPGLGTFRRNLYEDTLRDLLEGVTRNSPAKGLALYRQLPKKEIDDSALEMIARNIAHGEITAGEQRYYRELLDTHSGDDRDTVLLGVLSAFTGKGLFDEGMAIVDEYVQSPTKRDEYFESIFKSNYWAPEAAFDWLVASTPEEEIPAVMRRAVRTACFPISHFTREWIDRQEPGVVRDHAYAGYIDEELRSAFADDFPRVLPAADKIEDPALQAEIRKLIRTKWEEQDQEAVSPYIPAEVLERLKDL